MKAIHLLIICMLFILPARGQHNERKALDEKLSELKSKDNLSHWLYARIAYNSKKPQERLAFLMLTDTEIWRNPRTNEEREAFLNLLINQGYYQLYTGNILHSIKQYEKAQEFYKQAPLENFDLVEYLFKPLGNNYTRLGDYSNALFIQEKSLRLATAKKDSLAIASIYSNMAISYKSMGELKKAENSCLKGFKYLQQANPLTGLLYNTLADIKYEEADYTEASKNVKSALNILTGQKNRSYTAYWLLSAYTLAGNIEQKNHNFIDAQKHYNKGLHLINSKFQASRSREKANLYTQLGNIAMEQNIPKEAFNYYTKSLHLLLPGFKNSDYRNLPQAKNLYSENRLYDALEGRGNALALMGRHQDALNNYILALETGDKSRNEFANPNDRLYYQKQSKKLAELAITTAYNLWIKSKNRRYSHIILNLTEQTKARTLADQIQRNQQSLLRENNPLLKKQAALKRAIIYYEKEYLLANTNKARLLTNKKEAQYQLALLDKEIRKNYPSWNKTNSIESFAVEKLTDKIPPDYTILNFFWGDENAYLIKIQKGSIDTIVRLTKARELKSRIHRYVEQYFKHGPAAMTNNPRNLFNESHFIYQQLLSGIIPKHKQQNLVLIPDDILGYLPFESLITAGTYSPSIKKWPFLIKNAVISYAYSMQTWLNPTATTKSTGDKFNGFFISDTDGSNSNMPAVAIEAQALKKQVNGSFYLNKDATLKNFKNALNSTSTLHLSTHSFMFGKQAEPALQLSDGKFFLFELTTQHRVPNLVVLSACRTADGIMATGEGVLSLSRGFTAAGTTGVVAGLWNINDVATSNLITSFYKNSQKGTDLAVALHQAKSDWLTQEHSNPALLLPYYWSSLVYIGKPQIVELEDAKDYTFLYWGLTLIAFIGGTLAALSRKKSNRKKH